MVKITRQEFEKAHQDLGYAIDILNVLYRAEVDLHDNEKTAFSKILTDLIEPAESLLDGLNCGHSIAGTRYKNFSKVLQDSYETNPA